MAVDASFASVSVLLHFDGADGAVSVSDNSVGSKSFSVAGQAQIDTAQSKWGGSSLLLDGSGDYVQCAASADFAFPGDFTIEFWSRKSSNGSGGYDTACTTDTSNGSAINGWTLELSSSRGFAFVHASAVVLSYATNPNDSTWHHWALVRSGTTLAMYRDGVSVASTTYATSILADGPFGVGGSSVAPTYGFAGHIDDLRITKGVARYTGNFTPPAGAFPDGAAAVSGVVYDASGAPAQRTVRAYRRSTGALISSKTSDAGTGAYSFTVPTTDEVNIVVLDDDAGTLYNDVILRVIPA